MNIRWAGLGLLVVFVAAAMCASIAFGKSPIRLAVVSDALLAFDQTSREHLIVRSVRVPRALIALMVGACLATAGAIMQAVTRNGLAGPELFGINQGASLIIVLQLIWFGMASPAAYIANAFIGAALAGGAIYLLGSAGGSGLTPLKLILAGSTLNLLLASLTQGLLIMDEQSLDVMRFWLAGSLTGRDLDIFTAVVPFMIGGLVLTMALARNINLLSLGEEVAQSLGQRIGWVRAGALVAVMLLAGASVAIAGPIGFVGLAVPHIVRYVVGVDYRWVLPYSAAAGALLLLLSDIAARFILPSQEIPAGVVTAMLGAPFLIYLAQRRG